MTWAAQVLVFGDCAVNPNPDAEGLARIAIASADTAAAFGIEPPRVALLSYSTGASGSGDDVQKVRRPDATPGPPSPRTPPPALPLTGHPAPGGCAGGVRGLG